jgi:hypothetical protein
VTTADVSVTVINFTRRTAKAGADAGSLAASAATATATPPNVAIHAIQANMTHRRRIQTSLSYKRQTGLLSFISGFSAADHPSIRAANYRVPQKTGNVGPVEVSILG